jgi:hypothetical protein
MNTKIDQKMSINLIDDDIEFISDDDIEVIADNNDMNKIKIPCINNVINKDLLYETISDDDGPTTALLPYNNDLRINNHNVVGDAEDHEQQHSTVKPQLGRQRRSIEARKRRNRKRNNTFRLRRYHYHITRRVYYRFTKKLIRNILHQYNIDYTHVKTVDEVLIIGVKNDEMKQQNEKQLPYDIFDRYHYFTHRRHSQQSS